MHKVVTNLISIQDELKIKIKKFNLENYNPNIIAVSKTFSEKDILPLINYGHLHFGENKVQEAVEKWTNIKNNFKNIQLHMIGKLQTNKVKYAVQIFDYIHSVDNQKLAKKISEEQLKINKKIKIFLQVNIGDDNQKSGINKKELKISKVIAKNLSKDKIFFAGIDLINGYLIGDINVTSPTGLPQYKELTGINLAKDFWNEARKLK